MTTPLFPSVIAWNVLDGGTDAQDGNNYPGPALQDYAAAVVGAAGWGAPNNTLVNLATFGDSVTNNGYYELSPIANFEESHGWSTWIGPMSMQRVRVVKNWSRGTMGLFVGAFPLDAQVTAAISDPTWPLVNRCVILVGTNDFDYSIANCTAELLKQIRRLGKPVTLITSPPRTASQTVVGSGMPIWVWLLMWRDALRRIAESSGGRVSYVDAYSLGNTPGSSPDLMRADSTYDNLHPNAAYAYRIADAFVKSLYPAGLGGDFDLWPNNSFVGSTGSLTIIDQGISNPLMINSSAGLATGFTNTAVAGGSVAPTIIANPNGLGNMQRLTVTSAAAGDGISFATNSFHAAGGTFLQPGDTAWAQALITVNVGENGANIVPRNMRFQLLGYQAPTNYTAYVWGPNSTWENTALPIEATRSFLIRTPLIQVPDGVAFTNLQASLRPISNGAGTMVIDVGNFLCCRFRPGGVYS